MKLQAETFRMSNSDNCPHLVSKCYWLCCIYRAFLNVCNHGEHYETPCIHTHTQGPLLSWTLYSWTSEYPVTSTNTPLFSRFNRHTFPYEGMLSPTYIQRSVILQQQRIYVSKFYLRNYSTGWTKLTFPIQLPYFPHLRTRFFPLKKSPQISLPRNIGRCRLLNTKKTSSLIIRCVLRMRWTGHVACMGGG